MVRTPCVVLLGMVLSAATPIVAADVAGDGFRSRFEGAKERGDTAEVESIVAAWTAAEPSNPEIPIALANYYFAKAKEGGLRLSTKPPAEGDLPLTKPETGEVVGSLSFEDTLDAEVAGKARDVLVEAARKFPERLDIAFGLAFVQQELGDADGQYATIAAMAKYATAHPSELKWKGGSPLPGDPATFIPETVQPYLVPYYNRATPEDDERFVRLARLMAESYPQHPYAPNAIGLYHASRGEFEKARSHFETALRLAPKDPLILMNLGELELRLRDRAKARKYFQLVLESDAEEEIKSRAKARLAEPE